MNLFIIRNLNNQRISTPPTTHNFFLSQIKNMAKIRLFYYGSVALILPRLKDIANFVYKPLIKVNQAKFLPFFGLK